MMVLMVVMVGRRVPSPYGGGGGLVGTRSSSRSSGSDGTGGLGGRSAAWELQA